MGVGGFETASASARRQSGSGASGRRAAIFWWRAWRRCGWRQRRPRRPARTEGLSTARRGCRLHALQTHEHQRQHGHEREEPTHSYLPQQRTSSPSGKVPIVSCSRAPDPHEVGRGRHRGDHCQGVVEHGRRILRGHTGHGVARERRTGSRRSPRRTRSSWIATFTETPVATIVRAPMLRRTASSDVPAMGESPCRRARTRSASSTPISGSTCARSEPGSMGGRRFIAANSRAFVLEPSASARRSTVQCSTGTPPARAARTRAATLSTIPAASRPRPRALGQHRLVPS